MEGMPLFGEWGLALEFWVRKPPGVNRRHLTAAPPGRNFFPGPEF